MHLEDLWQKTVAAMAQCHIEQVNPKEVTVEVDTGVHYKADAVKAGLEEITVDEGSYWGRRRRGGKKEFSFVIDTEDGA